MKKKKISSLFLISAISLGTICIPAMAEELQHNNVETILTQIQEIGTTNTTGAAVEINDFPTLEDLENDDVKVTKLEAEIVNDALIGNKIAAEVRGYNSQGSEIKLNKNNIHYKWITKDNKSNDEKIIGNEKYLQITDDMNNLEIHCDVSYENN